MGHVAICDWAQTLPLTKRRGRRGGCGVCLVPLLLLLLLVWHA